jgi:hypothetical protein
MDAPQAGCDGEGRGEQDNRRPDSGTGDQDRKAFATVAAELALRGFALHELADGSYLVTRWNLTVPCASLGAAMAFLRQVKGQS